MDDLKIVRYYQSNKQIKIADRSEFGWVILFPENEKARQSTLKTYNKITEEIKLTCPDFSLQQEKVTPWLFFCVAVPNWIKT